MKKNQSYDLKDIIQAVKSEKLDDDFCLYAKENGELNFQDSYLLVDTFGNDFESLKNKLAILSLQSSKTVSEKD